MAQVNDIATGRKCVHLGHTPPWCADDLLPAGRYAGHWWHGLLGYDQRLLGVEWVEDAHEALVFWAEISIIAHIAAVVLGSIPADMNLPRAIVTGAKTVPSNATIVQSCNFDPTPPMPRST